MDIDIIHQELIESLHELQDLEVIESMIAFSQGEVRSLSHLWRAAAENCEVFPADISEALGVSRQRITSILTSLRKKGFVAMTLSESDRRRMRITLTDSGSAYLAERRHRAQTQFGTLTKRLGEHDTRELVRLTRRVTQIMKEYTD